jgi:hypothetical protein
LVFSIPSPYLYFANLRLHKKILVPKGLFPLTAIKLNTSSPNCEIIKKESFKSLDACALELNLQKKDIANCIINNTTIDGYSFIVDKFVLGSVS